MLHCEDILGRFNWQYTAGQMHNMLPGLGFPFCLGVPWDPQEELEEVARELNVGAILLVCLLPSQCQQAEQNE